MEISVVIPAYNERGRLPSYLHAWLEFLPQHFKAYEIIVVDDGSTDGMSGMLREMPEFGNTLQVVVQQHAGKGAAVVRGMRAAQGELRLFADADGATPVEELTRLLPYIEPHVASLAIGSRVGLAGSTHITRSLSKHYRGRIFATIASILTGVSVYDTQCGFKLFSKEAAEKIFPHVKTSGFAFDVEVLMLAGHQRMPIYEVPINWEDKSGSKIRPLRDSLYMLLELVLMSQRF